MNKVLEIFAKCNPLYWAWMFGIYLLAEKKVYVTRLYILIFAYTNPIFYPFAIPYIAGEGIYIFIKNFRSEFEL